MFDEEQDRRYNVYKINSCPLYSGISLVAAEDVLRANQCIDAFKNSDPHNDYESWGYRHVSEDDLIPELESKKYGIILKEIWYRG